MRVWRPRLPAAALRGTYLTADAAIAQAERLLPSYRAPDGDHEGIVFLAGREIGDVTLLTTAIAPDCDHGRGHVMCSLSDIDAVTKAAHARGVGVLAQVHSHPAACTEHSTGDDEMILMPFEGMLSIVVPHYARHGMRPLDGVGVHQYQDGAWVRATAASVRAGITLVPSGIDLR